MFDSLDKLFFFFPRGRKMSLHSFTAVLLVVLRLFSSGQGMEEEKSHLSCSESDSISTCFCDNEVKAKRNIFGGVVQCLANQTASVIPLYCVTTFDGNHSMYVAGRCPFAGSYLNGTRLEGMIANLTESMCAKSKRIGTLCGKCRENYSLSLNTPDLQCIEKAKCRHYYWAVYFITEFAGVTIFYLVILSLNIRLTSECAIGSLLFAQIIALPINIIYFERDWASVLDGNTVDRIKGLSSFFQVVYGIWNLDIPTGVIIPLCVPDDGITALKAFAIQYSASVCPLILISISFVLIKLYECNFSFVVWVSRPCRHFWLRFRRKIDTRATIIDIFASFLILSYTKLTYTSFILLAPTKLYNIEGLELSHKALLYDGSILYFSSEHTMYAVLAICVLCFFVLPPPLLLLFYQFHWFQVVLTKCRMDSHLLHLFVHSFQRGYKDGSNDQSKDLRWVSSINFFVIRILVFALYSFVGDYYMLYYVLHFVALVYVFIFAAIRPLKNNYFNIVECFMGLLLSFTTVTTINNSILLTYTVPSIYFAVIISICFSFPIVYMTGYLMVSCLRKFYAKNKAKILRQLDADSTDEDEAGEQDQLVNQQTGSSHRVRHLIHNILANHSLSSPLTERVPDRISNPGDYSDLDYEWYPEEQYTDTDTGTTRSSGTATGSTFPRSTYSEQNTGQSSTAGMSSNTQRNVPSSSQLRLPPVRNRPRPTSLRSIKLSNLIQDPLLPPPPPHPHTN